MHGSEVFQLVHYLPQMVSFLPYLVTASVSDRKVMETMRLKIQFTAVLVAIPVLRAHVG